MYKGLPAVILHSLFMTVSIMYGNFLFVSVFGVYVCVCVILGVCVYV